MLSSTTSSSFLTCADNFLKLKLPKIELHHEKNPKFGLLPGCPTILAEAQLGDRAQTKMASPASNRQSNYQTTQKLCICTKIIQTSSFRLNWLVSVHAKYASRKERKSYIHYWNQYKMLQNWPPLKIMLSSVCT